jgi:hypothetical protein
MTEPFDKLKYLKPAGKLIAHQICTVDRKNLSIERLLNLLGDMSQRISALENALNSTEISD